MKALSLALFAVLLAAGCASSSTTLVPPDAPRAEATYVAPEDSIFYTAQRIFVEQGFALARTDRMAGRIETEAKFVPAGEAGLDCDPGVEGAEVSFLAQVDGAVLVLRTLVDGDDASACRSTGFLEDSLFARIRLALNE